MPKSAPPATIPAASITGLILAGGQGRRMSENGQGVDKGLRAFRGKAMIAHVIERFSVQVGELLINANQNADEYARFGNRVIPDALAGFAGPLAGLHAGLHEACTDYLATAPCDSPFLPTDLVSRLADALVHEQAQVAVARSGAQAHPVFMLVDTSVRASLEVFLASGQRKIDAWYADLRTVVVDFDDDDAFRNINTPDELKRFE